MFTVGYDPTSPSGHHPCFSFRRVTVATTLPAWKKSKHCTTPCRCQHCTSNTKRRATSGCRNSLQHTLKIFHTPSSSTLPRKSTRGTSEGEQNTFVTSNKLLSVLKRVTIGNKRCRNPADSFFFKVTNCRYLWITAKIIWSCSCYLHIYFTHIMCGIFNPFCFESHLHKQTKTIEVFRIVQIGFIVEWEVLFTEDRTSECIFLCAAFKYLLSYVVESIK